MSNHSVIEHKANYHYIKIEEDYIALCTEGETSAHCKAMILSVLESWANTKKAEGKSPYVYMTYEQWMKSLYSLYKRDVILECLKELQAQELILVRQINVGGKLTYEYALHIGNVQSRLKALTDKTPDDHFPRLDWDALKKRRVDLSTRRKNDGTPVDKSTASAKLPSINRRILESGNSNLPVLASVCVGEGAEPPQGTPTPENKNASSAPKKPDWLVLLDHWDATNGPGPRQKWVLDEAKDLATRMKATPEQMDLVCAELKKKKKPLTFESMYNSWHLLPTRPQNRGQPPPAKSEERAALDARSAQNLERMRQRVAAKQAATVQPESA